MTITEIQIKTYERLDFYIDQIKNKMVEGEELLVTYWKVAVEEEHLEPKEAWKYLTDRLMNTVVPKTTLYRWADKVLPADIKQETRPKKEKIPTWESPKEEKEFNTEGMGVVITKEDDNSTSASESATGPNGEEIEREVEVPKGIETRTITELEYQELIEAARPQPTKASELPRHTSEVSGITHVPHDRIIELFMACKTTQGNNKGLDIMWDEGRLVWVNAVESNDIPKTKQENTEAGH